MQKLHQITAQFILAASSAATHENVVLRKTSHFFDSEAVTAAAELRYNTRHTRPTLYMFEHDSVFDQITYTFASTLKRFLFIAEVKLYWFLSEFPCYLWKHWWTRCPTTSGTWNCDIKVCVKVAPNSAYNNLFRVLKSERFACGMKIRDTKVCPMNRLARAEHCVSKKATLPVSDKTFDLYALHQMLPADPFYEAAMCGIAGMFGCSSWPPLILFIYCAHLVDVITLKEWIVSFSFFYGI